MKKLNINKQIVYLNKSSNVNSISKANINKTKKILKWTPKININNGLRDLINYE